MKVATLPDHIRSHIAPAPDGCWLWIGTMWKDGYGRGPQDALAHRLVYHLLRDDSVPVKPGTGPLRQLDHLCRNRACVNPAHLELVSARRNVARAALSKQQRRTPLGVQRNVQRTPNPWQASIAVNGRTRSLGNYSSPSDAGAAYDCALELLRLDGERNGMPWTSDIAAYVQRRLCALGLLDDELRESA